MELNLDGMSIGRVQYRCWLTAAQHGFHSKEADANIDQKLLLAIGELVEAQNELRQGHPPQRTYYEGDKPEGFGIELADAIIRILDLAEMLEIDLQELMQIKMRYNDTRPYKHGKQF